jgi:hypothetical protein
MGSKLTNRVGRKLVDEVREMTDPDVSPADDAARVAACVVPTDRAARPVEPTSPAMLDHDVNRSVNFIIVVDPAALASPDDPAVAQEALPEEPGLWMTFQATRPPAGPLKGPWSPWPARSSWTAPKSSSLNRPPLLRLLV